MSFGDILRRLLGGAPSHHRAPHRGNALPSQGDESEAQRFHLEKERRYAEAIIECWQQALADIDYPYSLHPPDQVEAELSRERALGHEQGYTPVIIAPSLWSSIPITADQRTRNAQQLLAEHGPAYDAAFGRELLAGTLEAFADDLPHNPDPALFDALQPVEAKPQGTGLQLLWQVAEAAIMRIPSTESHTIPVYLGWGGWNTLVPSDLEICAVSRHWGETYGVELIAVGSDTLEFSVARKPADHAAAVQLLREHCCFAPDGLAFKKDELEQAAALLRVADSWTFWWDIDAEIEI